MESEDDKVRDCNYGLEWNNYFQELIDKYWENDPNIKVLFQVVLNFSNTRNIQTTVHVDYQRYPDCPQWLVDMCMNIYRAIKSNMRRRKKILDEKNKAKAEKRKSLGL